MHGYTHGFVYWVYAWWYICGGFPLFFIFPAPSETLNALFMNWKKAFRKLLLKVQLGPITLRGCWGPLRDACKLGSLQGFPLVKVPKESPSPSLSQSCDPAPGYWILLFPNASGAVWSSCLESISFFKPCFKGCIFPFSIPWLYSFHLLHFAWIWCLLTYCHMYHRQYHNTAYRVISVYLLDTGANHVLYFHQVIFHEPVEGDYLA